MNRKLIDTIAKPIVQIPQQPQQQLVVNNSRQLGIFWDIENCGIPSKKTASNVVNSLRVSLSRLHPECCFAKEFYCVCNTHILTTDHLDGLNRNGVFVIHVNGGSKNAADDRLQELIDMFADRNAGTDALAVIITSDIDFGKSIRNARFKGLYVALIHRTQCSSDLKLLANETHNFDQLIDCESHQIGHKLVNPSYVDINDLLKKIMPESRILLKYNQIVNNIDQKPVTVDNDHHLFNNIDTNKYNGPKHEKTGWVEVLYSRYEPRWCVLNVSASTMCFYRNPMETTKSANCLLAICLANQLIIYNTDLWEFVIPRVLATNISFRESPSTVDSPVRCRIPNSVEASQWLNAIRLLPVKDVSIVSCSNFIWQSYLNSYPINNKPIVQTNSTTNLVNNQNKKQIIPSQPTALPTPSSTTSTTTITTMTTTKSLQPKNSSKTSNTRVSESSGQSTNSVIPVKRNNKYSTISDNRKSIVIMEDKMRQNRTWISTLRSLLHTWNDRSTNGNHIVDVHDLGKQLSIGQLDSNLDDHVLLVIATNADTCTALVNAARVRCLRWNNYLSIKSYIDSNYLSPN
ncbi:uncharacterized protein LOC128952171 isoform X2 [Oppia nitens]|uniref:uncharacterized protein LOC128952171 isoform X2 n=1 Tax=Oppia nitens TaxID=1686743 RepID=UPI0023DCDEC5|nr:uncharacterized protein LOC128952171 isoform X2 [Oppia nitens]